MIAFRKKMLLASILAVTLVFLLVGVVSFLPQSVLQGSLTTSGALSAAVSYGYLLPIVFTIAAIAVGVIVACLLFSEGSLKKEICE